MNLKLRKAFTLAEVLVTIGVIGVVSAITLPTIIHEHKKSVIANKLKKASATLSQAYNLSIAEYGDSALIKNREYFVAGNPDAALEMFNKYYIPYIKFHKIEKGQRGVFGYMTDGTGLYLWKYAEANSWGRTNLMICLNEKACKNIKVNNTTNMMKSINGKDVFLLYPDGKAPNGMLQYSRNALINGCKNHTDIESCTILIFEAGWKVPDDYPIRL